MKFLKGRQTMTMGRHSNGKALRFKVKSAGWGVGLSQGCVGCMVSLLILPIGGWLAAFADLWLIGMALCTSVVAHVCLLYTSPSPRDATLSRMPSSA